MSSYGHIVMLLVFVQAVAEQLFTLEMQVQVREFESHLK